MQKEINVKIIVNIGDRTKEEQPFDVEKVFVDGKEIEVEKPRHTDESIWDIRPEGTDDGVMLHLIQGYY